MPSNKSIKQAIQMKMKQHPSKKKLPTKTTSADSVSETISFVIKGKLTPIKPTFVARKVGVGKNILKVGKKLESSVSRKKQVSVKNSDIILCAPQTENEAKVTPKKDNSPKKVKKQNKVKNIRDSKIEVVIRKPTNKIVKQKLLRNVKKIKLSEDKNKIKILPTKTKTVNNHQIKGTSKTESKTKNVEAKLNNEDMKKQKTIAKLLKQANKELEKQPKLVKDRLLKPKIQKTKIIKPKKLANKNVNPIHKPANYSDDEIKKGKQNVPEKITELSSDLLKNCNREDSSNSDDNNLEEIRQSLKRGAPQIKKKTKTEGNSCNDTNKTFSKDKPIIRKKATGKQVKKTLSKIKKARIEDPKMRKLKLYGFWNRPKRQRVASLNAIAKVHCLYENEGRISMLDNPQLIPIKREVIEKSVKSKDENTKKERSPPPQRSLRYVPGLRGVGKHWDMHNASSSSSDEYSDDAEVIVKKIVKVKKEPQKKIEEEKVQKKRKRKQTEIVMDLKDMVVSKRMASLNATAILAASYSQERRHPKSPKGEITDYTDSSDDDSISDDDQKKSYEADVKKEDKVIEVRTKPNEKVAVIVNQDTDVTITGVYVNSTTRSTHHEGYCSIAGMQYRISATSHTQTAATAVATETLLQSSTTSTGQENSNSETLTPTGKSYKPLDALSNMRPPSGGPHHGHQTMGPPQHVMSLSPSGIRHGCSSAFTAPHPNPYHHVGPPQHGPPPPSMNPEPGYLHGYYQPAGPLITVPLGHGQPPLAKSAPLSETSPTTPSPLSSHPPHPASSTNGDSSDSEVIITSVTAGKDVAPPPQAHSSYRYTQYPPNVPPPSYSYPYSSHYYHPTPPPPPTYSPHDVCYSSGQYVHPKFTPTSYRRYLGGPQYYPPNPPPQDIYSVPPAHAQPSQQVVTATPVSGSGTPYQPSMGPPPPSTLMEPYPPTLVETYPSHYYPGYPPGPVSTCYSHAPPPRAVPFINGAYQSCPCPMQSCPKNGLTGPLTGDSKRSNTLPKNSMPPLPPVALALPKEPTSDGPPSPARGSAGMPPPPSPAGATYQQQPTPPTKQERISPSNEIPVEKRRKARVGKAMVRSNMQNTMLLMCNSIPANCVKREIESPMEKEIITVPEKEEVALIVETKATTEFKTAIPQPVEEIVAPPPKEPVQPEPPVKIEEKPTEIMKEEPKLEPVISTVGENVKVKNMKRKLSLSIEGKEEITSSPPKKQKTEIKSNGSYKNLIKKNTSSIRINNGRRKLIQESRIPHQLLSRATLINRRKAQNKRKLCSSKEPTNTNKSKQLKTTNAALSINSNKQNCKTIEADNCEYSADTKENIKRGSFTQQNVKSNQKLAPTLLDKLIAKNSVDRTIECVISDAIRTNVPKKVDKVKQVKEPLVPTSIVTKTSTKKTCKSATNRRKKTKCSKDLVRLNLDVPQKSLPTLRWSNGWSWEGESFDAKVFLNSDETTVIRKCYPSMRHHSGDLIEVRDCVLLKAGARRNELPFVAKIAALWENPEDGEMMMSLLWYYRPEHTEQGRQPIDQPDEVFASRHKDSNSVACIDDKCFVLTFNEYCRYRRHLRRLEEGIEEETSPCIPLPEPYPRSQRQPPEEMKISPEMVFFCRRVYDFRQKRMFKNPT